MKPTTSTNERWLERIIIAATILGILIGGWGFLQGVGVFFGSQQIETGADGAVLPPVREVGVPAKATVLSIRETGSTYNYHPEVEVTLQVQRPGETSYTALVTFYINFIAIPQVQPGMELDALVDPAHPQRVLLADESLEFSL